MKANYSKPRLNVEYFALSQSIASCGAAHRDDLVGGPKHWSISTCAWEDSFGDIFFVTADACGEGEVIEREDADDLIEGACYHNPEGGYAIFGS